MFYLGYIDVLPVSARCSPSSLMADLGIWSFLGHKVVCIVHKVRALAGSGHQLDAHDSLVHLQMQVTGLRVATAVGTDQVTEAHSGGNLTHDHRG